MSLQVRGVNELRRMFLKYFEDNGHLRMKSFSLVPHNDNSLLLINSGMAPLKPYFTGQEIPPCRRVTTCQKCIRTGDIENVGKTARHGTFFEMLGNFSFGDYFKHEAIPYAWNFLTETVGLDADRLYPSVYVDDQESFDIWVNEMHIAPERIFKFGKEDNFWEHGEGPCGPCTEIYYDRGEKYGCGKPGCTVGCECDRYVEVWNVVFSQFDNDGHGHYSDLAQKNIDTGMGLERLAMVVQDEESIYTVDTNRALLEDVCRLADIKYHDDKDKDISLRIVTDHTKSCTFMISDGIMPSNEGRGYVLRRLLRRAVRHGRKLGITHNFMTDMAKNVIANNKDGYPELAEKEAMILKVLAEEEEKFNKTIDAGMEILTEMTERAKSEGKNELDSTDAFKLYDTYGFPFDLTEEILEEKGMTVDRAGFDACMKEQKEKARKARKHSNYMGADATVYDEIDPHITSEFTGYDKLTDTGKILVLTTEDEITEALTDGQKGTVITDKTPFYATMGGQLGDSGMIINDGGAFRVEETIHLKGGRLGHVGQMVSGMLKTGDTVELNADAKQRLNTARNHSATHLLQKALRTVLGSHVEQAGSYVDKDRLRFDFTHFQAMTPEEIAEVEKLVNEKIAEDLPVETKIMTLDEAKKSGAMALFGEKYGDTVRVVKMGDFSTELCGGTHVGHTGVIQAIKILGESGIAAGVRRIEALTADGLMKYYRHEEDELHSAAKLMKTSPAELSDKLQVVLDEVKKLRSENEKLKAQAANASVGDALSGAEEVNGVKVLALKADASDANALRNLGDTLKEKLGEAVVVLAAVCDGKVSLIATATDGAVKKGAMAGNIIRECAPLVGGKGGGRPNMAQAGGTDAAGIEAALEKARELAKTQLAG
ncbi:MAG: alanine--tRNA ligase [Eubacteriales bacterium]|nr:alanine--tRNA ligase [Eubacteriales bacterium]